MLLSEEDMFSWVTEMAFEVYWRRFWTAPSVAAKVETLLIAALIRLTALVWLRSKTLVEPLTEPLPQLKPTLLSRPLVPSMFANDTVRVSPAAGPTWNVTPVPAVPAVPSRRLIPLNCTEPF